MNDTFVKRSALIDFRKTGLGAKNGISPEGWQMKTLARHLKDEGFWGVSCLLFLKLYYFLINSYEMHTLC